MHSVLVILMCSGLLGGKSIPRESNSFQFFGGYFGSGLHHGNFVEIGVSKQLIRNRRNVFKYGGSFAYYHYGYSNEIDFNKNYYYVNLYTGDYRNKAVAKYVKDHLRLHLFAEAGGKIISKKKFSSSISLSFGIGYKLIHQSKSDYYNLDPNGKPTGELLNSRYNLGTEFENGRFEFMPGLKFTQNFKLNKVNEIFLSLLLGYEIDFYEYSENLPFAQIHLGISID